MKTIHLHEINGVWQMNPIRVKVEVNITDFAEAIRKATDAMMKAKTTSQPTT